MVGDFLFVSKFCYGYCNHTFPFAPNIMSNRIWSTEPKQGDVVVFNNPKDEGKDYIKRLIGKPGDRVQVKQGVLHLNGTPVKLEKIEDYHMFDEDGRFLVMPRYIETLPNGVRHPILKGKPMGQGNLDNTEEFVVPAGHYFLMGDNRDNSLDSRVADKVGFVPEKNLIGRADILFFSTSAKWNQPMDWVFGLRYERILDLIR
jgi:signal peptidase I